MSKIVHFGKYYFPDAGGIESVTASLAQGAAQYGHDVTVLCFQTVPAVEIEVIDDVKVIRAPITALLASQPLSWRYLRLCLRSAKDADLIHLHAPNMLAAVCTLLISSKTRLLVHWHSDVIGKGLLRWITKPLERAMLRRADRVVAATQIYAEASPALRRFSSKVVVFPYGTPDPIKMYGRAAAQLPLEWAARLGGKRLILAVGRLVPYKGFHVLIEAAKHLHNDALVVIVGGGPLQEMLQQAIELAGVSNRVWLAGRLDDSGLHALFENATLFCLPSVERSEAFGVVLLEAMAYGLPLVTTDIPGSGVPWVNQNGVSGISVPVGDAVALANACNQILDSPDKQADLSRRARERFLNEFTEDAAVRRIMTLYKEMLEDQ